MSEGWLAIWTLLKTMPMVIGAIGAFIGAASTIAYTKFKKEDEKGKDLPSEEGDV